MKHGSRIAAVSITVITGLFGVSSAPRAELSKQDKPAYQSTGSEGTLSGKISFLGEVPEPRQIDESADPFCQGDNNPLFTEDAIVTRGKLANVVVYVRSGDPLEWYVFDPPTTESLLAQHGCQLVPHVLAMQTRQILKISNDDATTHNTHVMPKSNPDWNQSQPANAEPLQTKFRNPEIIPVKDNQHPWEKAYVAVFAHPFFAVSAPNGSYKISGLPPGSYTVVAWHERFGEQTAEISIGIREQKNLDFAFKNPKEAKQSP